MDNVLKKGYLFFKAVGIAQNTEMVKRYYVLYGATPSMQARLDYYEDESSFNKNSSTRKTIYIEEIKNIEANEKELSLELTGIAGKDYYLSTAKAEDFKQWERILREVMTGAVKSKEVEESVEKSEDSNKDAVVFAENDIYDSFEESDIFEVEFMNTDASKRCDLFKKKCYLTVSSQNISAKTIDGEKATIWPYKYIRRYGRNKNGFTFEVGRKCSSGAGLFSVTAKDGNSIFNAVQRRTESLKVQDKSTNKDPQIPERHYRNDGEFSKLLSKPSSQVSQKLPDSKSSHVPRPNVPPKPKVALRTGGKMPLQQTPIVLENEDKNEEKNPIIKKSAVASDFGKTFDNPDADRELYMEVFQHPVLDSNYKSVNSEDSKQQDHEEHHYALYDVSQSSRYKTPEQIICGPTYDEPVVPDEAASSGPTNMMDVMAKLRTSKTSEQKFDDCYSHLHVTLSGKAQTTQRPLPSVPNTNGNEYEDAEGFGAPQSTQVQSQENLYDEVEKAPIKKKGKDKKKK